MNVAARCGCVQSQRPNACTKSPYPTDLRAVGGRGFAVGSTTHRAPSPGFSRFGQLAKLGSTSHPSTGASHRGCGLWGGWDAGAVSATASRSLSLTRDGADRASSWRALDVVIEDLERTRNFLSRLRLPHACDMMGGNVRKVYYIRANSGRRVLV